jgi:hypothetical protein
MGACIEPWLRRPLREFSLLESHNFGYGSSRECRLNGWRWASDGRIHCKKGEANLSARAFLKAAILATFVAVATSGAAWANILIVIDKTSQRMSVTVDGVQRYTWPVSTGRPGYSTPSGTFTPFRMEADHFSQEWDDAPMPYSIFFTRQGHAIHGSYHSGLGAPRSHGCVRVSPSNAAILYSLVQAEGLGRTKVVLTGAEPSGGFGFGFGGNQWGMFPFRQY